MILILHTNLVICTNTYAENKKNHFPNKIKKYFSDEKTNQFYHMTNILTWP